VENAIEVENLSKVYRLGEIGTGTLSRDLHRWVAGMMGKEDPFLKVGEVNDRSKKGDGNIVYSLKDLNFSIAQGETVGIIGRNGAGKSTLLKILSRVTSPTTGEVRVRGRIASLLEVGTGFHPELTGRENIYLNSAILGLRKKEINSKFDEIVDFSGVERYIDTPVKRYSSGMYVRLAFAVAAHLESEILIVDEVLAVGDSDFQNKCLGKMRSVSHDQGRTVLFVSHNMASVKALCQHGIMMVNGQIEKQGPMADVIEKYLSAGEKQLSYVNIPDSLHLYASGKVYFRSILIRSIHTDSVDAIPFNSPISSAFSVECMEDIPQLFFDIKVVSREGIELSISQSNWNMGDYLSLGKGSHEFGAELENQLQPGNYFITIGAHKPDGTTIAYLENIINFEVLSVSYNNEDEDYNQQWKHGYFRPKTKWEILGR
jgi:lipopolysaccharide transport system ATP-binding protein